MIIVFALLLIVSLISYMNGNRVLSLVIFFFFLFDAFQIIPESLIGLKASDFAIAYISVLFIYGCIRYDDFIPKDKITILIGCYLLFILFECLLSLLYYHISISDILRTGRQNILVLSYFIFRRVNQKEVLLIMKILFIVVLIQCVLFLIQAVTGQPIMTGDDIGGLKKGFLYRYYNSPILLYFFVFYAIFNNPFKGWVKLLSIIISVATIFAPMHRSLSVLFLAILFLGIAWKIGWFNSLKRVVFITCLGIIFIGFGVKSMSSRTMTDINSVMSGEFLDVEMKLDSESTLLFRLAHFYERYLDVTESTVSTLFGRGFMAEGSSYTLKNFDFIIGLDDPLHGEIIQVDTSDIAWSIFILRYGIIGTILYLIFYFSFGVIFIRRKNNQFNISIVCYLLLLFSVSLTADQLYYIKYLLIPILLL